MVAFSLKYPVEFGPNTLKISVRRIFGPQQVVVVNLSPCSNFGSIRLSTLGW